MTEPTTLEGFNLDVRQLARIEAMHGGFLYQHLYAAACLFHAARAGVTHIVVENDEDVEIVHPQRRIYAQIKMRSAPLIYSDINSALERFAAIRAEHSEGRRGGKCQFAIVSSSTPGPDLADRIKSTDWPDDVAILLPGSPPIDDAVPPPPESIAAAFDFCRTLAEKLPLAILAPETLVWKLAGRIMAASGGVGPNSDHTFATADLPALFEQLVIQLQDFPAPPLRYHPQQSEPSLVSDQRVRMVIGFSGAGKTSWVSQAALHTADRLAYYDVTDVAGPALASAVGRELAALIFGKHGGKLGEILLPGASGIEVLLAIGRHLAENNLSATVVLDNAHRVPVGDLAALTNASDAIAFVLLAQPGAEVARIEATLGIAAEPLLGWSNETTAAEGASLGCHGNFEHYEQLLELTGGLPLYVQNALKIAAQSYEGSVERLCAAVEARTHVVATAQELILADVFEAFSDTEKRAVAALSLSEVPLTQAEAGDVLQRSFDFAPTAAAAVFRKLRSSGSIQVFGFDRIKIHDAMRPLGRSYLDGVGAEHVRRAREAIRDLLIAGLTKENDRQRVFLLLRMFVALGNIKPLVEMATDELFHEMGYMQEISDYLVQASTAETIAAEDRFWALDGLVFADLKEGNDAEIAVKLDRMEVLVRENKLGLSERLAVGMKRMLFASRAKDVKAVEKIMRELSRVLPETPQHLRVAKYNYAHALYELGMMEKCTVCTLDLIAEYYDQLGLTIGDVMAKNPDAIFPLLKKGESHTDDLKHLADTLDLQSKAVKAMGNFPGLAPIHAMKFYSMAQSLESFFRVGQDLVDDFIARHDYIGARDVIERNLMPTITGLKLAGRVIPVRSQYAVALAYCGAIEDAEAEMARLAPYEGGLDEKGQWELRNQRALIAQLKLNPPPPQWEMPGKLSGPLSQA